MTPNYAEIDRKQIPPLPLVFWHGNRKLSLSWESKKQEFLIQILLKPLQEIAAEAGLKVKVCTRKIIFVYFNQNICCGYSKEPSHWDGSFEHPKHMLKIMGKKILTILRWNFFCSSKPLRGHFEFCFCLYKLIRLEVSCESSARDGSGSFEQPRVRTGLKSTWIYMAFLKSPWKLNLPWKVLEKYSNALKSHWILLFSVGFNTVDGDLDQYKVIVVPLFGAAYAAPNKGTTMLYLFFSLSLAFLK